MASSDPLRHVEAGEPVPFNPEVWNAFVDAAKAYKNSSLSSQAGQQSFYRDACIVRVKNETGEDLTRFSVLGLGDPIFTPDDDEDAFLREVTFRGHIPEAVTDDGRFCILLEPALAGRVVKAYLAGVCIAWVDVVSTGHKCADVVDGDTGKLQSADSGNTQILWKQTTETGEQWAVIRMGGGGSAGDVQILSGVAEAGIGAREDGVAGSGNVTLFDTSDPDNIVLTEEVVPTRNDHPVSAGVGSEVKIFRRGGVWWLLTIVCEDPYA